MSETVPIAASPALHNLHYFEVGYAVFWVIFFAYLLFLHVKISRIEKGRLK